MDQLREQFEQKLQQLNEDAGRGRGTAGGFKTAKKGFEDFVKTINYDYLNRSTHHVFRQEPYNFNNYYSLDIRVNIDKLLTSWEAGQNTYNTLFDKVYGEIDGEYATNMREALYHAYVDYYKDLEMRKTKGGKKLTKMKKNEAGEKVEVSTIDAPAPPPIDSFIEGDLDDLRKTTEIEYVYSTLPAVSIYTDEQGREHLAIKKTEFVPLIMDGLKSAARGNVPQGVTIEEVLQGKFSRKAIAPEQGTFINRVKDPTSDKDFDFRSWEAKTLETLHALIMNTFKNAPELRKPLPELRQSGTIDITRSDLVLYMKQDDFNKLEKGGKGFSDLGKAVLKDIGVVNQIPDF
jgi:hypothetical protein